MYGLRLYFATPPDHDAGIGGFLAKMRYIGSMNAERALYEDPAALDLSHKRALADIKAGRVVPNEAVTDWLKTWGTSGEKPMPAEWLK